MTRLLFLVLALLMATGAAPFDPLGVARIDPRPGARVPLDGALKDSRGYPTSLAALARGRPILLVPVLHSCPNFCGVTLDGLASAVLRTKSDDVAIVAFGIDPNESPADARAALGRLFVRYPALVGKIDGTIGAARDVHAVTDALGYRYAYDPRLGQYAHAAATAVLTHDGRLVRWLYGLSPETGELRTALDDARGGRTEGITARIVLLCYHYDPATGTYSLAIDWLLRAGCLLTVLVILGYVFLQKRRARRC